MIEKLFPLKFPPGLYRNGTKYEAKGRWYNANLVRFYEGAIRPVQGWRVAFNQNNEPMPALEGVPRAAFGWRSIVGEVQIAVGTNEKLYVIKDGVAFDVTPIDFTAGAGSGSSGAGNGDYGNGAYGMGLYGMGRAPLAAQLSDADTWQLDAFGDTLVACCTNGGRIYVWTGNTAVVADVAAGSPEPNRGVVITPERFLMALGADDDVRKVMWASQGTTTDWTPVEENTAGDFTLTTQGRIMCGRRTKAQTLIFTDTDMHSATYIGGEFIYSFKQEGDNCGIISPQAVAIVDANAIWMGRDNFYLYDGFVKPIPCSVHDYVFDDFNAQQASKVFACPVSEFGEVWFFYPSSGSEENDRYVVFNYRENHWTTGTLSRTAAIDRGALPNPVMFDSLGTIYTHELSAGGDRVVPLPTLVSDDLLDTDDVLLEAHTPDGSPTDFDWRRIAGSSLRFVGNVLLFEDNAFLFSAPFTGTNGTSLTGGYSIPTPGGTFVGGNIDIQSNRADGLAGGSGLVFNIVNSAGGVTLSAGNEVYCDVLHPTGASVSGVYGFMFLCNNDTPGEGFRLALSPTSGSETTQVDISVHRYNGSSFVDAGIIATGVAVAEGALIRLGLTVIDSDTFDIWTEPAGGGARTARGTYNATVNYLDSTHNRVGLVWNGLVGASVPQWDNLTIAAGSTPVLAFYVADLDPEAEDYQVTIPVRVGVAPYDSDNIGGVGARMNGSTDNKAGYYFAVRSDTPSLKLFALDASGAELWSETCDVPDSMLGSDLTLRIRCVGTTIMGIANGVTLLTHTDSTYTSGYAGVVGSWPEGTSVVGYGDSMTDTNGTTLQTHTPDGSSGFTWTKKGTSDITIQSGNLVAAGATSPDARYVNDALTADGGDFTASMDIIVAPSPTLSASCALLLLDDTAAVNGYRVVVSNSSASVMVWSLGKITGGGVTVLDSDTFSRLAAGTYRLTLTYSGSTITAELAGMQLSAIDTTYTTPQNSGLEVKSSVASNFELAITSFGAGGATPAQVQGLLGEFSVDGVSTVTQDVLSGEGSTSFNENGEMVLVPFLESGPIELGDGDHVYKVQRIVPDEKNLGDVRARFFKSFYPTEEEVEVGPYTLANPTATRFTARQVRLRLEEVNDTNWRIGVTRLGIIQGGRR